MKTNWQGSPNSPSHRQAAEAAALRHWNRDLLDRFSREPAVYEALVAGIDDEMQAKITAAELRRRGDGLQFILDRIDELVGKGNQSDG